MSRSTLELTDLIGDKVAFGAYKAERLGDNSRSLEKMRQYMYSVIRTELTEQQRKCIMLLITEGKKQKEIAAELGLNQSTVSRHLAAARKKLLRSAKLLDMM